MRLKTILALTAVAAVLPAAAFDWKSKPIAELKADLVAYARKVGETNFADRVEKSAGAAEWMGLAIGRGAELLKASEGCDFRDKRREHGLRIIDYPLHFDNYSPDASLEDVQAFNEVVYAYCASARDRVFAEVANAKIPEGQLRLWRIYNMGFIIKGPRHAVAIDVTNLPMFRDKPDRRCAPNKDFIVWKPEDWRRLVEMTDMFVLTHPHGDHYCGRGIAAYLAAGKPVVLPCGLDKLKMPAEVSGTGQNCIVLAHDNPKPIDVGGVKIWNFMGHQGKKVPCNVYLMEIDGVRVAHNGDNSAVDKEMMLAKCPPADVIIASTWNRIKAMVGACAAAPGFDRSKAVLIPSHENELTHPVSNRESYWEMYERKDRLGDRSFPWPQVRPLGYGESVVAGAVDPCRAQPLSPAQIEEKIRGYMDEDKIVGMAVVVVKGGKPVYQKAFGYRDKDTREPLDINDIFRIASISKSFSGVSIMQLVEAGKMSLDDDINDILGMKIRNPRYPDIPVTVRMLLSHTSGMKDGGGYRDLTYVDESKTDIKTIRDKAWLPYPPGKGYKYCNRAINIMGLVIEKVSGERFDEYVLNHILKPIGADNAGYNIDSLDHSTIVQLYNCTPKGDRLVPSKAYVRDNELKVADGTYQLGKDGCYWSPTGGMKISAPNLVKWMLTLKNGGVAPNGNRIISEEGCKTLLTPVTPADPGAQYCLTTRIETRFIEGKRLVGHTGSAQGLFSCMYFCPDEDWGFVCICSSGTREKVNGIRKAYYRTINLLYDQYVKPTRGGVVDEIGGIW